MDVIQYKLGERKRPVNTFKQKLLLRLCKIPLVNSVFKRLFLKAYNLPMTTSFNIGFHCSAPLLYLGNNVGLGDTKIIAYAPIEIGDNSSFSFNNMIITSTHDISDFSTVIGKPVVIGNNVWITSNVTILPGVTIGDNTIIGAGSVVTRNIPAGVFAAGNPCKVIKQIDFKK